jgi:hypothetical protein
MEVVVVNVMVITAATITLPSGSGYSDISGSGDSGLVHQSYLLDCPFGVNNFSATLGGTSQYWIAIPITLGLSPLSAVAGRPTVTVSPVGSESLGYLPNNGADFGPDTPGTKTCGIQEAVNAVCNVNATGPQAGAHVVLLPGTFVLGNSILLYEGLFLEGSSQQGTTIQYYQSGGSCLEIDSKLTGISGVRIANLRVNYPTSGSTSATAINLNNINNSTLDKVLIDGYWQYGIWIGGGDGFGNTLLDVQILAGVNTGNINTGLEMSGEGGAGGGNRVIGGRIQGCSIAIAISNKSWENNIIMVDLGYNNATGAIGINIDGTTNYTNILGCWFEGLNALGGPGTGGTAINIASSSVGTMILNPFYNDSTITVNDANYPYAAPGTIPFEAMQIRSRTPYLATSGKTTPTQAAAGGPFVLWNLGYLPLGIYRISGYVNIYNWAPGGGANVKITRFPYTWGVTQDTYFSFNGPTAGGSTGTLAANGEWEINSITFTCDGNTNYPVTISIMIGASPSFWYWASFYLEQLA